MYFDSDLRISSSRAGSGTTRAYRGARTSGGNTWRDRKLGSNSPMARHLLCLKYHDSIADAVADLGKPEEIGKVFSGFQKYLYQEMA